MGISELFVILKALYDAWFRTYIFPSKNPKFVPIIPTPINSNVLEITGKSASFEHAARLLAPKPEEQLSINFGEV